MRTSSALIAAALAGLGFDPNRIATAPALPGRSAWRRAMRSRTPGPVRPAGSKLARMAAEHRIAKAHP